MEIETIEKQIELYESIILLNRKEIKIRQNIIEDIELERQKLNDKVLETQRNMALHYVKIAEIEQLIELVKQK
jgi:hypothetical protein